MTSLAIGRLANRVRGPDAEAAWAAGPLLDLTTRRLPAELDRLLPATLRAAGLPDEAVVALRRIDLRLSAVEDPDVLARAWATAIADSLSAALQMADLRPAGGTCGDRLAAASAQDLRPADGTRGDRLAAASAQDEDAGSVVFADPWSAEAEILRLLAAHRHLPWWADAVAPGASVMSRPAGTVAVAIFTSWI
jgi:hypothetical protein